MYRTVQEQRELTIEAERRVRAGERSVDVARALGLPPSTLADWARRGGWRRKDLVAVRNVARGEMVRGLIDELVAEEHAKQKEDVAKLSEALQASKAELETVAPGGRLPLPTGGGVVPAGTLAMAMADNLLRQGQLEEADRAVRLAARFREAEQAANASEEARWRDERERLMKWWADTQTAYRKLHTVTDQLLADMVTSMEKEVSRSAEACCPKCGRRMDFWPKEVEAPEEDEFDEFDDGKTESGDFAESGSGESRAAKPELAESGSAEFARAESGGDELRMPIWDGD
jgi:hypothetical protein